MAQTSYPFDEQSVTEDQWSAMMSTAQESRVVTGLAVFGDSSGRQVKAPLGTAWVRGHFYQSTAEEVLAVGANASGNPRIDTVVLTLDPTANSIVLAVVAGTAAATPVPPTLTQTTTGVYQYPLADVAVANGAATITANNVTPRTRVATATVGRNIPGRNLLHNGAMQVAQRGASFAGTAGIVYTADRWFTYRAGGATGHTVTWAASGLAKIQYCARVQRDSGNASTAGVLLEQDIETVNSIPVQGDTVTLSFWARKGATYSAASGAMDVLVQSGTGTDQRIQSGFAGAASVVSTAVTLTADWQRFTVTGSVPASSTQLGVRFGFTPVGTASTGDYFEVTGVQLETGSAATGFEFKGCEQELAECQRYYEIGTARCLGYGLASNYSSTWVSFAVTKRGTTTVVQTNTGATNCSTSPLNIAYVNGYVAYRTITATSTFEFIETWTASADL